MPLGISIEIWYGQGEMPQVTDNHAVLTWGNDPIQGVCWTLHYVEDKRRKRHLISADLVDVDHARQKALYWLNHSPSP